MADWGKRAHELILDIEDVLQEIRLARSEDNMPEITLREAFADVQALVAGYLREYHLRAARPAHGKDAADG